MSGQSISSSHFFICKFSLHIFWFKMSFFFFSKKLLQKTWKNEGSFSILLLLIAQHFSGTTHIQTFKCCGGLCGFTLTNSLTSAFNNVFISFLFLILFWAVDKVKVLPETLQSKKCSWALKWPYHVIQAHFTDWFCWWRK